MGTVVGDEERGDRRLHGDHEDVADQRQVWLQNRTDDRRPEDVLDDAPVRFELESAPRREVPPHLNLTGFHALASLLDLKAEILEKMDSGEV